MLGEEDEFGEALERQNALRKVIYQLKGEFISEMTTLEGSLDHVILFYFGQALPAETFRSWLLARIHTSGKIEVVANIFRAAGLGDIISTYLQELRAANQFRNELAHSSVGPDLSKAKDESSTRAALLELRSLRTTRSGISATRVEADDLTSWIGRLYTLQSWTIFLMVGVLAHLDGRDALLSVTSMERGNPGIPKLT